MSVPDLVEQAHFRSSPDGRSVFFPWRLGGRGYVLADEARKQSILRVVRLSYGAMILLGSLGAVYAQQGIEPSEVSPREFLRVLAYALVPALVCVLFYGLWWARIAEQLPPSDLRVSRAEIRSLAASRLQPGQLRQALLASWGFVGLSLFAIWIRPDSWWLGALGVLLGLIAAGAALRMRRWLRAPAQGDPVAALPASNMPASLGKSGSYPNP